MEVPIKEILTNDDIVRHIMIYADIHAIMNMLMVARIDGTLNVNFWFNKFARDDYWIIIVKLPENTVGWIREYLTMKRYHEELMTFVDYALFESYKFTNVLLLSKQEFNSMLDKNLCPFSIIDCDNGFTLKSIIESIKERKRHPMAGPHAKEFFSYLSISKENRMWELTFDFEDIDNIRIIITGWGFIKPVLTPI
jgi:hypothetical protein